MKMFRAWFVICGIFFLSPDVIAQFTYVTNGRAITITRYTGSGGAVTISNFVTSIGTNAFDGCTSLTSVTIPASVTSIGDYAFYDCYYLYQLTISNGVTTIGDWAFTQTCMTSVTIPSSVTNIGARAFFFCISLTNVLIPNSVTSIGDYAFMSCSDLTSVTIPASVTNIGVAPFADCDVTAINVNASNPAYISVAGVLFNKTQTTLIEYPTKGGATYTFPGTVTSIGAGAFAYTDLTSVTIPASVTNIGAAPFLGSDVTVINVNASNPAYISVAGVLFNKTQTTLIEYVNNTGETTYTIPGTVTSIGEGAFVYAYLTSVTIPNSVTSIGEEAFENARLTSVTIPGSVTNIGAYAFESCNYLGSVTISNGVTSIGEWAFSQTCLTSITIPASVTNIGAYAFWSCGSLSGVYFAGNAPSVGSSVFSFDPATIYYPSGTTGWSSTFCGLPAVLWNPPIQTSSANFGVRTNKFGFAITGPANIPIVVQARTNLASGAWTNVQSCTLTNGSIYFTDPAWANYQSRFYRISYPYP